ncbi:glutamate-5-semialdehyde dehydrogenase [Ammoniphilus oxalaticus]|uniref:Gamma-glutamyl phosphate reductase n=1 Tax=Ammoniphilus oxalaticus TaxID=66863 RepID=A0A419SEI4_9BACL|nr:glutamate-5-semialdehyde dehydrogenase [Ammoniphilus oxalaticus]RKD21746.1 glutamate-5-semialdehyde dehydrogenase [Ammoniphilus oxalaticus]
MSELLQKGKAAKQAAKTLGQASTELKNKALQAIADGLSANHTPILAANKQDVERAKAANTSAAILDRLILTEQRIQDMVTGVKQVIELADPLGEIMESYDRPNGIKIDKVRVPLGVIGIIYEARPNVTADAAALCLKTGNCAFLRGSSSALESNKAIVKVVQEALTSVGLPATAVQLLEDTSYETSDQMLQMNQFLDVLIPRGGAGLIEHVVKNATVPVLETGIGNCHVYIDEAAEPTMAVNIALNAKTQRPGVCNAVETLLVHKDWGVESLNKLISALNEQKVKVRACSQTKQTISDLDAADESDWATEYLDLTVALKLVDSVEAAIEHIDQYGSGHSECIVTENEQHARKFLNEVDAAAVYHNVSTRFTDGFEFGFGAEIGISTQKLHARGPMGLKELTSYKYILQGTGQIRS